MNLALSKNQKGFSLIEMLLVLGVLAVLLVAAFVVYPRVRDASRANNEVTNLTAIKASINNLYATKGGNYENINTNIANQARAFPSSMNGGSYATGTTINSSWGGEVTVAPGAALTVPQAVPANRSFTVTYTLVPEGVCLGLVSGAAGNFTKITIGGAANDVVLATTGFSPSRAAELCTGTPTVVFYST